MQVVLDKKSLLVGRLGRLFAYSDMLGVLLFCFVVKVGGGIYSPLPLLPLFFLLLFLFLQRRRPQTSGPLDGKGEEADGVLGVLGV